MAKKKAGGSPLARHRREDRTLHSAEGGQASAQHDRRRGYQIKARVKGQSDLRSAADERDFFTLSGKLLSCPESAPSYCLALPHRFNSIILDLLDHRASGGSVS